CTFAGPPPSTLVPYTTLFRSPNIAQKSTPVWFGLGGARSMPLWWFRVPVFGWMRQPHSLVTRPTTGLTAYGPGRSRPNDPELSGRMASGPGQRVEAHGTSWWPRMTRMFGNFLRHAARRRLT